jgi:hypothetical protein
MIAVRLLQQRLGYITEFLTSDTALSTLTSNTYVSYSNGPEFRLHILERKISIRKQYSFEPRRTNVRYPEKTTFTMRLAGEGKEMKPLT